MKKLWKTFGCDEWKLFIKIVSLQSARKMCQELIIFQTHKSCWETFAKFFSIYCIHFLKRKDYNEKGRIFWDFLLTSFTLCWKVGIFEQYNFLDSMINDKWNDSLITFQ